MLFLLSPAKSLDFSPAPEGASASRPRFPKETAELVEVARGLTVADLRRLMDISEDLAKLNHARFRAFGRRGATKLQAAFAFAGDVYDGLDARSLDPAGLDWAQQHLRILSGLYGVLRPLDRIEAHRLEMGTRLRTPHGIGLYNYWGHKPAGLLKGDLRGHVERTVVNLASHEYFHVVDRKVLGAPVVNVRFLEEKDGEARIVSFFAKRARGSMARFAVDRRIERAEDLKGFDYGGYRYSVAESSDDEWTFARPQPEGVTPRAGAAKAVNGSANLESV